MPATSWLSPLPTPIRRARRTGLAMPLLVLSLPIASLHALACSDESASTPPLGPSPSGASGGAGAAPSATGTQPDGMSGTRGDAPSSGGDSGIAAASSCRPEMPIGCDTGLDPQTPDDTGSTASGGSSDSAGSGGSGASAGPADAGDPEAPDEEPPFSPCPRDGSPCVVMPFGDSITEGFPVFNGGYRVELFHQALLGGHSISFVGARANGPATVDGQPFPTGHEGYSGFTIDPSSRSGISPRAEPAIAALRPHIILLMIGTNDIDQNIDVASAPARLGALIDRITTAAPDLLLVVAQIIPTTVPATNERIRAFDGAIPALVQARQAAGKHVLGVDMFAAFASNINFATALMVDSLHPNDAGYALLGQRFYQTIEPFLSPAP